MASYGYAAPSAVTYANWGQRVGGYLIDIVIQNAPVWVGGLIAGATADSTGNFSAVGWVIYVITGLVSLGLWIYNRWIQGGGTGQTWGRKALKIKLVSEQTGQPIGAGMAFVRDIAHILDTISCYIGWLWPLWDAKRQTFADKILKTVVVPAA